MIAQPQTEEQTEKAVFERQKGVPTLYRKDPPLAPNPPNENEDQIISSIIDKMNKTFAVLQQPTFLILEENEDGTFSLDRRQSFKERFENQVISLPSGKKTNAELFLKSPKRRTF